MDYHKFKEEENFILSTFETLGEIDYELDKLRRRYGMTCEVKNMDKEIEEIGRSYMKKTVSKPVSVKLTGQERFIKVLQEVGSAKKVGNNTFHKKPDGSASKYATLSACNEALKPVLEKYELGVSQPIVEGCVQTVVFYKDEQITSSELKLPLLDNMQKLGSAITYARRYTLSSLFNLDTEDDDGNAAVGVGAGVKRGDLKFQTVKEGKKAPASISNNGMF